MGLLNRQYDGSRVPIAYPDEPQFTLEMLPPPDNDNINLISSGKEQTMFQGSFSPDPSKDEFNNTVFQAGQGFDFIRLYFAASPQSPDTHFCEYALLDIALEKNGSATTLATQLDDAKAYFLGNNGRKFGNPLKSHDHVFHDVRSINNLWIAFKGEPFQQAGANPGTGRLQELYVIPYKLS